jgi:predicted transcriptional regulator
MNKAKIAKLKKHGWNVGTTTDFLGLTPAEEAFVELKVLLAKDIQKRRLEIDMTQLELAQSIHSSQSRVAKIEKNDPTVSLDLMVKALLALKATSTDVIHSITGHSLVTGKKSVTHSHKQIIKTSLKKAKQSL